MNGTGSPRAIAPHSARRGVLWVRWAFAVGLAIIVLPMPTLLAATPPAGAPPMGATPIEAVVAPPGPIGPASTPSLPGSDPSHERVIDAPQLALQEWRAEQNASATRNVTGAPAPPLPAAHAPRPTPAAANGTITGRIYDLTHGRPIFGVFVTVQPFGSTYCPPGLCSSNSTDASGDFTLTSVAGAVEIVFTASYYLANRTWGTVTAGGTLGLGTLYMVHDAMVTAIIEDATPDGSPIANVSGSALSRDGSILANPGGTSETNGSIEVPVPPLPSEVTFTPSAAETAYLENVTWVNATPYQTIDLGVIHLEGGVRVEATLVDRTTGLPILSGSPSQITMCSRRATLCLPPIEGVGPNVTGVSLPGAVTAKAYAIGYLSNFTDVPDVPNTNQVVDLGTIFMTPLAVVEISTNLTGGTPPPGGWPLPDLSVNVCSLDGLTVSYQAFAGPLESAGCWPQDIVYPFLRNNSISIGSTALVLGPPMHDIVMLQEVSSTDEDTLPFFPLDNVQVLTPLKQWPESYTNETWINATPDRVTVVGSVDVTPGTYLQGNVSIAGFSGSDDGQFEVQVCSRDIPSECGSRVGSSDYYSGVAGCAVGPTTFCAPAPTGPDVITVTQVGPMESNRTWVEVPRQCCAQDGRPTDVGWINLTLPPLSGSVSGSVVAMTGGPGSPTVPVNAVLVAVEACPVGPPPLGLPAVPCSDGAVNATGQFEFNASLGWDKISVDSSFYQGNFTWVDVTGNNSTGVIELEPKAAFYGQVVGPNGAGLTDSVVDACPVAGALQCYSLGTTSSDGIYNGSAPGGPLPWGTYQVVATSSGYASSWDWVNSTPGAVTRVPTIVLAPIGSSAPSVPSANGSVGAWVDGRLIDARTGYGIPNAQIVECSILTNGCGVNPVTSTAGGTFNLSVLLGQYYLQVDAIGYPIHSIYVNATGSNVVHLGPVSIPHFPWVHGRVEIAPWQSLAVTDGLGAAVFVVGCPPMTTFEACGPPDLTDTDGFFNASVPVGGSSFLQIVGRGISGYGTAPGGYDETNAIVSAVGTYVSLPTTGPNVPTVPIFGALSGRLADGGTWNTTDRAARAPCTFCTIITQLNGSATFSYLLTQTSSGGNFTVFLPSDGNGTSLTGESLTYWPSSEYRSGSVAAATVVAMAPLTLPHYGWVTLRALDAGTGLPLPYYYASAAVYDPVNGTTWQGNGLSRGDGWINISAPLGSSVNVTVTPSGYFPVSQFVSVGQSETVPIGNLSLSQGGSEGLWVRSLDVNTVNTTPFATVIDAKTHAALPGALIATTSLYGSTTGSVLTNGLGQFLLFSPATSSANVHAQMVGYAPATVFYNTSAGFLSIPYVNLTGDGIVAGRAVVEPSGAPLYDVEVTVCPVALPACSSYGLTNASGYFWVAATPGYDVVTILTEAYLTNVTAALNVVTDRWSWVGSVPVYEFASITGRLLGLPAGVPIAGANVSVCSPFGFPTGPCGISAPTDGNGDFLIPAPPSTYILEFEAAGYNTSYLPVTLQPGENLSVGNIFLLANGTIRGTVVSALSGFPIWTATVLACAEYASGLCSTPVATDSEGQFLLPAAPGANLVTVSAPGYFDNFTEVFVPSGGYSVPLTIGLLPLSADLPESVAGTVVAANRSDAPIPGAFVSADQGGVAIASAATDPAGHFLLPVPWGSYSIVASAPGYSTVRISLAVHANLTGLILRLPTMLYNVSGTVRDALTGAPLDAVHVEENGTPLTSSLADGTYYFLVPNGSYSLVAAPTGATGGSYQSLPFTVTVSGHDVLRDIQLTESSGAVTGLVVDANSGLPVPTASVAVYGTGSASRVGLTDVSRGGVFSVALAPGNYTLNVSAPGYSPASVAVQVPGNGAPITVALAPLGSAATLPALVPLPIVIGATAGGVLAAIALVVWWRRRPPPPPGPPRWTLEDLDEPVDF